MQFDREREPWWAVQDAGLDIVALCDTGGTPSGEFPSGTARAVAQFGYDAYGSVVTAETLFAHALLRAGHKGLFFDRLDLGIVDGMTLEESPRLAVGADLLGYARNRVYSPRLGRWVQRDPNASGQQTIDAERHTGARWIVVSDEFDIEVASHDGASLLQFAASNPGAAADPLGLFISGIGPTDTLMLGFELGRVAFNLIDAYAGDLDAQASWAADWSLDDDLFWGAEEEEPLDESWTEEDDAGAPPAMAGIAQIKGAIKAAQVLGRVRSGAMYHSYHAARYAIRTAGARLQAHHIVEVRVLKALGKDANGPAIALTRAQHRVVTRRLRKELPYGTELADDAASRARIVAAYRKAYEPFPELLDTALKILE